MIIPQDGTSLSAMDISQYAKVPHRIIENILMNCIKLNDPLRRYGHRSKQASLIMKVEEIQSFMNGAQLLDLKDLLTSKGPLDEFTMAEKVATERFIREAGYGLSLANQRQYRLF
ncbi:uncharacterized protein N7518_007692 [Penicillium psychrosexuale]|uniref:uncharacterized protein n=1 Tax=Penicillium psychrosexuale TaxID=1002107 RepID=UPI0025450E98|nr:uncharacterized protein N7518_007692 [Penicillium psychrosexuale]KAJ5790681.1 hypothetical protein N7518_007692 [Penicillium psychrosexuale]